MTERKYLVAEIDRMREAVENLMRAPMDEHPKPGEVENRLRTYMQNGTDPEELERESADYMRRFNAERESWERERLNDGHLSSLPLTLPLPEPLR